MGMDTGYNLRLLSSGASAIGSRSITKAVEEEAAADDDLEPFARLGFGSAVAALGTLVSCKKSGSCPLASPCVSNQTASSSVVSLDLACSVFGFCDPLPRPRPRPFACVPGDGDILRQPTKLAQNQTQLNRVMVKPG